MLAVYGLEASGSDIKVEFRVPLAKLNAQWQADIAVPDYFDEGNSRCHDDLVSPRIGTHALRLSAASASSVAILPELHNKFFALILNVSRYSLALVQILATEVVLVS